MNVFIISCSHRKQSQSFKVAKYIEEVLKSQEHQVYHHDCGMNPLPMWTPERIGGEWATWDSVSQELNEADALILVTPEWNGMSTPQAKNLFLLVGGSKAIAHKAGLIVSVSAGRGGAYPIVELRSSSYKNTKINWIPEHLIVREVESVLNDKMAESKSDQWIRDRIDFTLTHLSIYSEGLKRIRAQLPKDSRFGNGM